MQLRSFVNGDPSEPLGVTSLSQTELELRDSKPRHSRSTARRSHCQARHSRSTARRSHSRARRSCSQAWRSHSRAHRSQSRAQRSSSHARHSRSRARRPRSLRESHRSRARSIWVREKKSNSRELTLWVPGYSTPGELGRLGLIGRTLLLSPNRVASVVALVYPRRILEVGHARH